MHRSQLFGVNAWKSSTHPWRLKAGVRRMLGSLTFPHSCHLTSWRNMETWKHTTESSWASQPSEKLLEQPEGHGKVSACQLNLLCSAWTLCWTQTWKKSETMKTQIIFSFLPGLSRRSLNTWPWALPLWVPGNHRWDVNLSDSSRITCWIAPQKKIKVRFYEYRLRINKSMTWIVKHMSLYI